ncbi:MAG: PH domain-containing protein [Nanoarchaeota archaeon]|nr:PH domain-containing protein [Nanoarchaeota archaeon]
MRAPDKEEVILTLRKTRKAYIVEYSCGFVLLILMGLLQWNGINLRSGVDYFAIGLAFFSFAFPEYKRLVTKYTITPSKFMVIYGLIKQTKLNFYFTPLGYVLNINSRQNRVQRLLNYGTIYISGGTDPNNFTNLEIKNINRPHFVLQMIEDLIEKNRPKPMQMAATEKK